MKPRELATGRPYRTRNGLYAQLSKYDSNYHYPWFGHVVHPPKNADEIPYRAPTCWRADGAYLKSISSELDIVSE